MIKSGDSCGGSTPSPKTNRTRLHKFSVLVGGALGVFLIYALSFGPVLCICGAKASTGWNGLPVAVQIIYQPLRKIPACWLTGVLDDYTKFWIDIEH